MPPPAEERRDTSTQAPPEAGRRDLAVAGTTATQGERRHVTVWAAPVSWFALGFRIAHHEFLEINLSAAISIRAGKDTIDLNDRSRTV